LKENIQIEFIAEPGKPEIITTAVFDAPRGLVFKVYTDQNLIPKWWGPRNLTTTIDKMELRQGGAWRFIQRDAEGKEYASNGVYLEVMPPEKLVSTFNFEPMPGHELVETSIFEEENGKTKLTAKDVFQSVEDRDGMVQSGMESGLRESMERLSELLDEMQKEKAGGIRINAVEKPNDLMITRILEAPRETVWKAWTDCEIVKNWCGPKGFTAPFCRNDFRAGGKYLYAMKAPEGKEAWSGKTIWSTGVYREIVPMKRIVSTDSFADENGNVVSAKEYGMNADFPLELMLTVTFEDMDGKTKITLMHVGFPTAADRDGAREGWNESLDKLETLLKPMVH
jgi:uncharacterized protein YndB with AHSA1/START domain